MGMGRNFRPMSDKNDMLKVNQTRQSNYSLFLLLSLSLWLKVNKMSFISFYIDIDATSPQ